MKLIYKHENQAVVYSIKNVLELNDINCFLKNEYSASIGGNLGLSNSFTELWVSDDNNYEKASSIIANEAVGSDSNNPWVCEACQEENEGSFEICWNCQKEQAG